MANQTGHRNIYRHESGRFAVQIMRNGRSEFYGHFKTIDEAVKQRDRVRHALKLSKVV